jgi:hypothetical protein
VSCALLGAVVSFSIGPFLPSSGATEEDVNLARTFSDSGLDNEELSDVMKLEWRLAGAGMEFSSVGMIATDDRSQVIFRIDKGSFAGGEKDPLIARQDEDYFYFRVPERAIIVFDASWWLVPGAVGRPTITEVVGLPLICRDNPAIAALLREERWKSVVLGVTVPLK